MSPKDFEAWSYNFRDLASVLGEELYTDVIGTSFSDSTDVASLQFRLGRWLLRDVSPAPRDDVVLANVRLRFTAFQLLQYEVEVIEGSRRMSGDLRRAYPNGTIPDELSIFVALDSATDDLPLEDQRRNWDDKSWRQKQERRSQLADHYRPGVLLACRAFLGGHRNLDDN